MKCVDICVHGVCNLRVFVVVLGGFLVHLAIGGGYIIGNFAPYFISYIRNRTDDVTVENVDALWVTSIGTVGNMFGISVGGLLAYRFGPKITIFIGCIIFSTSVAMSYYSVDVSYISVVLTYGLTGHFGDAITYGTSIQTAIKWLPSHATLAAGLIASGTGLGSIIFNPIVTAYINPDNELPEFTDTDGEKYFINQALLDRVPMCFVILGACYFGLQFIGCLCISDPNGESREIRITPETEVEKQALLPKQYDVENDPEMEPLIKTETTNIDFVSYGSQVGTTKPTKPSLIKPTKGEPPAKGSQPVTMSQEELSIFGAVKLALSSRSFYIIWLTCFMLPAGMQFIVALYKAYGQTFIYDDHFLTLVGTTAAVFNCLGRPLWGIVMDHIGFKITLACVTLGFSAVTGTLFLTEDLDKEWFLVWICSIYLFYGGIWAMMPSALAKLLGPKHMSVNYGLIASGSCLATLIGSTMASTLKTEIGWHGIFYLISGMSGVVFIASFFFNGVARDGSKI